MPVFRVPAHALARFIPPHTAQVNNPNRAVTTTGISPATGTTGSSTASAVGGSGTFAYAWSCTNGWSADSPSSATTTFTSPAISWGATSTGVATVTITDLQTGATATATVNLTHTRKAPDLGWTISPTQQVVGISYPIGSFELSGSWTVIFTGGSGDYTLGVEMLSGDTPKAGGGSGNTVSLTYDVAWLEVKGSVWRFTCVDNITGQTLSVDRAFTFINDPNQ